MFFANLGLGQFLALFGAVSAVSVAIYLLDRSRRHVVVSTLRFWNAANQPTAIKRRKHIQQPISLLVQLIAMLLLLLAIAQLRIGSEAGVARKHVIVLETSAWMGARATANETLMDAARSRARAYLGALPAADQVILIRADALATPATPFEADRRRLEAAIAASRPSATSLNLEQAMAVARAAQRNAGGRGEIVFIGSGRVNGADAPAESTPNLRVLPVGDSPENLGLKKIGLRRSPSEPDVWEILVTARNYGGRPREAVLSAAVSSYPAGAQRLELPPNGEAEATFAYRTRASGLLRVRLLPTDGFPDDNHAEVELPTDEPLPVTVYSDQPQLIQPILAATHRAQAVYRPTGQYTPRDKGLVILDRFRPDARPSAPSIWIDPPAGSPIPVRNRVSSPSPLRWLTDNALGSGLRTRDIRLPSASVLGLAPGDVAVAEIDSGPVIAARPANPKMVAIGFRLAAIHYDLATPLLFANIFRWMAPDAFLEKQINTQPVGTVNVRIAPRTDPATIRVLGPDGTAVPFTLSGESLHFFSGTPGMVRVISGDRESVYSLTLPEVADAKWNPPSNARKGLPSFREVAPSRGVWQGLALVAGALLLFEWTRWGRSARRTSLVRPSRLKRAA